MTLVEAIILGSIQGITEFLPISSSGHLVIAQSLLGLELPGNIIEVVTHLGTLLSVIIIFRKDIMKLLYDFNNPPTKKYILFLLIGTIPALIIGLSAKSIILLFFESVKMVSLSLIITGLILFLSKKRSKKKSVINYKNSFMIGISQALAIMPGISRSGITISTGILLGMDAKEAARFSFLLAIPVIAGATLITAIDMVGHPLLISYKIMFSALASSFVVGYLSLKWFLVILENGKLHYFGFYCITIGLFILLAV